ncbi:MAG TPA: rRNA maturation RNase YbeY [archaeon]|nr:rRNA maturation RNase YbeY [archaeon]
MIAEILSSHRVKKADISLTFVGRDKIRSLNRNYLGRSRVTDVLAFDLSDSSRLDSRQAARAPLLGDIYICCPRALEQAERYGVPTQEEIARLAAHGVLHLLGYDHENAERALRMTALQEEAVKKCPLPVRAL